MIESHKGGREYIAPLEGGDSLEDGVDISEASSGKTIRSEKVERTKGKDQVSREARLLSMREVYQHEDVRNEERIRAQKEREIRSEEAKKWVKRDLFLHHERELREINTELTGLLAVRRNQEGALLSFLPSRRREREKLQEEIDALTMRARLERMKMQDLEGSPSLSASRKKKEKIPALRDHLYEVFDALQRTEDPFLSERDHDLRIDATRELLRGSIEEKVKIEAELGGWMMAVRPFRQNALERRLHDVEKAIKTYRAEIRAFEDTKK